jgi:hypothetical protein
MSGAMREVHLPAELCEAAEQRYGQRFAKLDDFLVFVLQELLRDDAARMDQEEQHMIEKRLRDLGYV